MDQWQGGTSDARAQFQDMKSSHLSSTWKQWCQLHERATEEQQVELEDGIIILHFCVINSKGERVEWERKSRKEASRATQAIAAEEEQ